MSRPTESEGAVSGAEKHLHIGVPSCGPWNQNTSVAWAQARAKLRGMTVSFSNPRSSNLVWARTKIVWDAKRLGADGIFWFDSDSIFPDDTPGRLLAHGQDFVGAAFRIKDFRGGMSVFKDGKGLRREEMQGDSLIPVDFLGLACTFTSMPLLNAIGFPWFDAIGWVEDKARPEGYRFDFEDAFFCKRAREVNCPIYLDPALSRDCYHGHYVSLGTEQDYLW